LIRAPSGHGAGAMFGRLEEIFVLWSAARAEANVAYDHWCASPGADAYAVYRAAEDRADAAEAELAQFTAGALLFA
jgi:hypothetical protein